MTQEYNDKLNGLNQKIEDLKDERTELINEQDFSTKEKIRQLEWTKGCNAYLSISPIPSIGGTPEYTIKVSGKYMPSVTKGLTVMGDSDWYYNNVTLNMSCSVGCLQFVTSDADVMVKFIEKTKFKSFSFDKNHLRILLAAHTAQEVINAI